MRKLARGRYTELAMKCFSVFLLPLCLLAGCAAPGEKARLTPAPPVPVASAATPSKPVITQSAIKAVPVARPQPLASMGDGYIRLVGQSPVSPTFELKPEDGSPLKIAARKLANYLWDTRSTLLIVAQPLNFPNASPPKQQLLYATRDGNTDTVELHNVILTPYFEANNDLAVRLESAQATNVDSQVIQTAVEALAIAAKLGAGGGVLAPLAIKDYSSQAAKLDSAVEKLLSTAKRQPQEFAFNPYTTERIDLVVQPSQGPEEVLLSLKYEQIESLIGKGKREGIPKEPVDISKTRVSFVEPATTIRTAIEQDAALQKSYTDDKVDSLQVFCRTLPARLADLGLNRFDRMAVAYAYLRDSSWNSKLAYRVSDDSCSKLVASLSDIPQLLLNSTQQLMREAADERALLLRRYRDSVWKDIPLALQNNSAEAWQKVLADEVRVSATGGPVALKPELTIAVGEGNSYPMQDVADALGSSSLVYKKEAISCFSLPTGSTGRYFSSPCVSLQGAGQAQALEVEFTVADSFQAADDKSYPLISAIRFITKP